ncbi:MAG: ribulose-phosphate 3-epimerase [Thermoguttaceae bacterium]|nr:ribulose-phosphate 3-epimerase [Thermoguttaceae bacterium]
MSDHLFKIFQREPVVLGPSLLAADFASLATEMRAVEAAGLHVLHVDVMDGVFVPNLSFGFPILESVRSHTRIPFDCHLMIADPDRGDYIERFGAVGAAMISFHLESFGFAQCSAEGEVVPTISRITPEIYPMWNHLATRDAFQRSAQLVKRIHQLGAKAGIAISPKTPLSAALPFLEPVDFVLIMSVEPGFGNQSFMPETLDKVRELRRIYGDSKLISIDGGVKEATIGMCVAAGVRYPIAGTAFFRKPEFPPQSLDNYYKERNLILIASSRTISPKH